MMQSIKRGFFPALVLVFIGSLIVTTNVVISLAFSGLIVGFVGVCYSFGGMLEIWDARKSNVHNLD